MIVLLLHLITDDYMKHDHIYIMLLKNFLVNL